MARDPEQQPTTDRPAGLELVELRMLRAQAALLVLWIDQLEGPLPQVAEQLRAALAEVAPIG